MSEAFRYLHHINSLVNQPGRMSVTQVMKPESLAAMGEPTLFYAGTGIGKTTLAQRVALSAISIGPDKLLGFPIRRLEGSVLYIAADRPVQAMRSLRRMVTIEDRAILDERWLWEHHRRIRITPDRPEIVYEAAVEVGAQLVILDSIKDLVSEVSLDRSGQAYNDAVQICVANGIEIIALHHPRKATADGRTKLDPDSVYGSAWITAGAGSVIALNGAPGAGIARLQQLKMPSEEVGPFDIDFDYDLGTVTTIGKRDLAQWICTQGTVTTAEATRYLLGKDDPTDLEKRKVRRKLNRLQTDGEISSTGESGDMKVWRPALTIGKNGGQGGRSGVGQGGRSPENGGSVTEDRNVDAARAERVGHTPGHTRSQGSVNSPPSREGGMTTPTCISCGNQLSKKGYCANPDPDACALYGANAAAVEKWRIKQLPDPF